MSSDLEEPLGFLNRYYQAFSTLNVDAVLPFYHEPSMFIGAQGANAVSTRAALGAMVFTPMMKDLSSRGFHRSEFSLRHGQRLSDTMAVLIGIAIRYKADCSELERLGITYIVGKQNTDWEITVLVAYDPN